MFAVRVSSEDFGDRMDAGFYHPYYLSLAKQLVQMGASPLISLVSDVKCGPFGGNAIADDLYSPEGISFIRPVNISSNLFDDSNLVLVPKVTLQANGLKTYHGLNLYFGRVGVPCVAVIEGETSISPNIIIANTDNEKADPHYLHSFLASKFGLGQLQRQLKEVAQPTTSTDAVRQLLVFIAHESAQKYIGNKVRQAETLRTWANELEKQVNKYHLSLIQPQAALNFSRKTRSVTANRLTDRLDSHFYPAVVDDYLKIAGASFETLNDLCVSVFNGQTQPETTAKSCEQITVTNLSPMFLGGISRKVIKPLESDRFLEPHDLLLCNAAHNKSYIGRDITYNHSEKEILPSTEVMVIRVDHDLVPASYLRSYLLTKLGYVQLQSTIRGITAHSYPTDVKKLDIPIPKISKEERSEWFACDRKMVQAGIALEISTFLTTAAKLLVEALIEGKITEQDLISAQQALEKDDPSLDRQILARLTNTGIDNDAPPLFPDLDQLQQLLEQAANSGNEV